MSNNQTPEDVHAVRRLLAAHDPADSYASDPKASELARIEVIASARTQGAIPRVLPRRPFLLRPAVLGVAAALAATAVLVPFALQDTPTAYAAPPPVPLEAPPAERTEGGPHLLELADAAAATEAPDRGGDVAYVRTSEWTLTYAQDVDNGQAGWGIMPEDRRVWRTPDESGVELAVTGEPEHMKGDRGPLDFLTGDGTEKFVWGDGEGGNGMFFSWEPETLSTEPAELERQLLQGTELDAGTPEATLFYALQDLYTEAPVDPQVQAAVLRGLAEHDGVLYAGSNEDRHGREGELFVVEDTRSQVGGKLERRIMFDSDTGAPLYFEVVAVESDLEQSEGLELPLVNHYAVITETAWVAEVEEQP